VTPAGDGASVAVTLHTEHDDSINEEPWNSRERWLAGPVRHLSKTDGRRAAQIVFMTERYVERLHGMRVVGEGSRQAPPLVLIHGSGAAGGCWALMVAALAGQHHVIRVDLPGCGQSAPAPSYDVPAQADRVARVLDDLGVGRVAVAAHSSGGYVGTALAEQRPDLVRSLVLISTGPSVDALLRQPLVLRALLGPPLGPLVWSIRSEAWIRKGVSATAARPVNVPDEMVAGVRRITYRTMRAVLRQNTAYIAERSVPARLAALDVPVLAIWGAADPRWDPAASARQYDAVPKARVESLPGVGHLPILEAPEATGKLLLDFTATGTDTRP
jgi:pimeloyl-ACP methyl ester carboxylesterase